MKILRKEKKKGLVTFNMATTVHDLGLNYDWVFVFLMNLGENLMPLKSNPEGLPHT